MTIKFGQLKFRLFKFFKKYLIYYISMVNLNFKKIVDFINENKPIFSFFAKS